MDMIKHAKAQWDRALAGAASFLGLIALVAGWFGASGTPELGKQIPYFISGGLGAIFLLGVGGTLWLSADLRDQWRELRRIRTQLERTAPVALTATVPAEEHLAVARPVRRSRTSARADG